MTQAVLALAPAGCRNDIAVPRFVLLRNGPPEMALWRNPKQHLGCRGAFLNAPSADSHPSAAGGIGNPRLHDAMPWAGLWFPNQALALRGNDLAA